MLNTSEKENQKNKKISLKMVSPLSTAASIKGRNIKLRNNLSSFNILGQTNNSKKSMDFPVCISILANNLSINDNDVNLNVYKKPKLNLKFAGLKTKFINRKNNSFILNSFSASNANTRSIYSNKISFSGLKKETNSTINFLI